MWHFLTGLAAVAIVVLLAYIQTATTGDGKMNKETKNIINIIGAIILVVIWLMSR